MPSDPGPVLEIRGITKAFGGLSALKDISFTVEAGTIHGVIGPNGAGKTTLFNIVTSLFPPTAGQVLFEGQAITGQPAHRVARLGIARTFQNVRLFGDQTALENVIVGTYRHTGAGLLGGTLRLPGAVAEERRARSEAAECLDFVGLVRHAGQEADALPFGQQRLLEVARALAMRPKLLLLDEPAAGLNDSETEELARLIRQVPQRGLTVMLVEHNMDLMMSVADRIVVLDHGTKIAEGDPETIRNDPEVMTAYLGMDDPA